MASKETTFITLFRTQVLPKVEIISLLVILTGLVLYRMEVAEHQDVLLVGFSTLAGCYFLTGFMMVRLPAKSKTNSFAFTLNKLIFIAAAVTLIGLLFILLSLEGGREMLLVGCGGLAISLVSASVLIAVQSDNLIILKSAFIRGFLLLFLGIYFIKDLSIL